MRGLSVVDRPLELCPPVPAEDPPVPAEDPPVPAEDFHEAMCALASGLVLVTAAVEERAWGMTVSSCCSVSDSPPTVLISLGERTVLAKAIHSSGRFGVSVLGETALEIARFGAQRGTTKFLDEVLGRPAGADCDPCALAVPGALSQIGCAVTRVVAESDHLLFLGRVQSLQLLEPDRPLLYFRRDYRGLRGS